MAGVEQEAPSPGSLLEVSSCDLLCAPWGWLSWHPSFSQKLLGSGPLKELPLCSPLLPTQANEVLESPAPAPHPCLGERVVAGGRVIVPLFLKSRKSLSSKLGSSRCPSVSPCGGSRSLTRNPRMIQSSPPSKEDRECLSLLFSCSDCFPNSAPPPCPPSVQLSRSIIPGTL